MKWPKKLRWVRRLRRFARRREILTVHGWNDIILLLDKLIHRKRNK